MLQDKVVMITGAGAGLGCQLALEAARNGALVAVCARSDKNLDAVGALLQSHGYDDRLLCEKADITALDDCRNFVDMTVQRFGRIDALINNAFQPIPSAAIEQADFTEWRAAFEINVLGTLQLTRQVIPQLKRTLGAIVMINSMNTRKHADGRAGVAASKGALMVATQYLAEELGQYGIRVNTALMGWMWGPPVQGHLQAVARAEGISAQDARARVEQGIALGRIPDDADCAKACIFLASGAAGAITRARLDVKAGADIGL
jgi:NAD(P)-dependent dehydrogenase (short-subunit alcohol dehydrogenase family)